MTRPGHTAGAENVDLSDVTAVAVARPYDGRAAKAVAPAPADVVRRLLGSLHEPNAWTAGILLATGVALIARHPIAHALGTEVDTPAVTTPAVTAPVQPAPVAPAPAVAAAPVLAAPTHAPRNPFAALIQTSNNALTVTPVSSSSPPSFIADPPSALTQQPSAPPVAAQPATPPAPASSVGSCSGTVHRVVAGDTLWGLAARAVKSSSTGVVSIAWHRLYDANRAVVGGDPSLLRIGTELCVPTTL
jgi:nucleoid-associated protein YgaU